MSRKLNLGAVTAYAIAVKNGYKGTEAEWLASLKGADGVAGPQGPQGPQGEQGANGANGYTPVKGTDYFTEAEKQEFIGEIKDSVGGGEASPYEELYGDSDNPIKLDKLVPGTYKILKGSYVNFVTTGAKYPVDDDVIMHIGEHYLNSEGRERFEISGYFKLHSFYQKIVYSAGEGTTEAMHYYTIGWGLEYQMQEGMRKESAGGGLQASNLVAGDNIDISVFENGEVVISATGGSNSSDSGSGSSYVEAINDTMNSIHDEEFSNTPEEDIYTYKFSGNVPGHYLISQTLQEAKDIRASLTFVSQDRGVNYKILLKEVVVASNGIIKLRGISGYDDYNFKPCYCLMTLTGYANEIYFQTIEAGTYRLTNVTVEYIEG